MNYEKFTKEVLRQVKAGIDSFNSESDGARAEYPSSINIEYKGIEMIVPFTIMATRDS